MLKKLKAVKSSCQPQVRSQSCALYSSLKSNTQILTKEGTFAMLLQVPDETSASLCSKILSATLVIDMYIDSSVLLL